MSKSRASKNKAVGAAIGMNIHTEAFSRKSHYIPTDNRQTRRMLNRGKRK